MKKIFKVLFILIAGVSLLGVSSCKKTLDNLADLNKNENQPLKASSPTLLTAAEFSGVMADQGGFGDGFIGIFSQHSAGNHATGVDYNQYILKHGDFQFLFNDAYVSSLMNLKQLIANAGVKDQKYVGIAQILQAYQLGYLTSIYGDIPWSQSLDVLKYPHPKYDAQIDIYTQVQNLLTSGIINLNESGASAVTGDIIYQGDAKKWKGAAYLLKARFYNHFSKKDPAGSATSALLMVDSAKLAGLTSSAGDFTLPYDGLTSSTTNPWVCSMYPNGMVVASKPFLDSMSAQNDPRINAYFTRLAGVGGKDVYGLGKVISGTVGTGAYMSIGPGIGSYFGAASNSSILLASYPELLMIEAEAAFRSGNTLRAANAHNAAVTAQINTVVSNPSDLAKVNAYLANFANENLLSINLSKIMTEKHKLMFTMEVESWMDVRRSGYMYPSFLSIPVVDETTMPMVPVAQAFIQRLLYPQSELDKNTANVPNTGIFDKLPILQ